MLKTKKSILILGATSTLARAIGAEFASHGYSLILLGRDAQELDRLASDFHLRHGVDAKTLIFDALDFNSHREILEQCEPEGEETLEGAILCTGYLGDQSVAQSDFSEAKHILDVNLTASISLLNLLATRFEKKRAGFICALSSVAGDRGRRSNYIYGAAKGGLSVYLEGLRNRLFQFNVHVITVKPGVADTQMTYALPGLFLRASPEKVAKSIYKAILQRKDVFYTPFFWRWIMFVIRNIPDFIFKRQKL